MDDAVIVREWDADSFHKRVFELEAQGYCSRRETYHITPEMNPETGEIIHLHTIEMFSLEPVTQSSDGEDAAARSKRRF